jgi:hypothetical protein
MAAAFLLARFIIPASARAAPRPRPRPRPGRIVRSDGSVWLACAGGPSFMLAANNHKSTRTRERNTGAPVHRPAGGLRVATGGVVVVLSGPLKSNADDDAALAANDARTHTI